MQRKIGSRVRVKSWLYGQHKYGGANGTIIGFVKRAGVTIYRVRLDESVESNGQNDELWAAQYLQIVRET